MPTEAEDTRAIQAKTDLQREWLQLSSEVQEFIEADNVLECITDHRAVITQRLIYWRSDIHDKLNTMRKEVAKQPAVADPAPDYSEAIQKLSQRQRRGLVSRVWGPVTSWTENDKKKDLRLVIQRMLHDKILYPDQLTAAES